MFCESGIVVLNKPCGISSNSAVNRVKKTLNANKCGHLGTLDLEAEGVLLVTVNSATKLFDLFLKSTKTYEAVFEFGRETDTLDASGKVIREQACEISRTSLEKVCKEMIGKQMQMPPQFSAKKVGGKVAYAEARAGREVELSPKEIEIFEFCVLSELEKNVFRVRISCSSGTYIRALARDTAKKLGTVGLMRSLVRTRCEKFGIERASDFENIEFIPSEKLFDYEKIVLNAEQTAKILNGQKISIEKKSGRYKLFGGQKFLGLADVEDDLLKLTVRLV